MSGATATNVMMQKDPNVILSPGVLSYECTPAELKTWCEDFKFYFADGYDKSPSKAVSYIQQFMSSEYKKSIVPAKLSADMSLEDNLKVLEEDKKIRYPVLLCRLKLFVMDKQKEETILGFINRVREDSSDLGHLSKEDIIIMLIVEKCNVPELQLIPN